MISLVEIAFVFSETLVKFAIMLEYNVRMNLFVCHVEASILRINRPSRFISVLNRFTIYCNPADKALSGNRLVNSLSK